VAIQRRRKGRNAAAAAGLVNRERRSVTAAGSPRFARDDGGGRSALNPKTNTETCVVASEAWRSSGAGGGETPQLQRVGKPRATVCDRGWIAVLRSRWRSRTLRKKKTPRRERGVDRR
jgi:hypothetical protein